MTRLDQVWNVESLQKALLRYVSDTNTLDPLRNPYHPFKETDRYRAFRDGWAAQRKGRVRSDNPYSFSQVGKALAWLDGWTAAIGEGESPSIGRRPRSEIHQLQKLKGVWTQSGRSEEAVDV